MAVDVANKTQYGVVVKTNKYAGNFERAMTAYCTGRVGECGVGEDLVPLFMADFNLEEQDCDDDPFWDALDFVSDDHGCPRPCTIYDSNDRYQSVLMFFVDRPTKKQIDIIQERATMFSKDARALEIMDILHPGTIEVLGLEVLEIKTTVNRLPIGSIE
jgi:hypothetical protein